MYQQFSVVFTYFVIHVCHINIVCIYLKSKCLALAYGSIWLYWPLGSKGSVVDVCDTHAGICFLNQFCFLCRYLLEYNIPTTLMSLQENRRNGIALVGTPWRVRSGGAELYKLTMAPQNKHKRGHIT